MRSLGLLAEVPRRSGLPRPDSLLSRPLYFTSPTGPGVPRYLEYLVQFLCLRVPPAPAFLSLAARATSREWLGQPVARGAGADRRIAFRLCKGLVTGIIKTG
jgi:hypothetical protein